MTRSRRWQTFSFVQQAALRSFERLLAEHERLLRQIAIDKASEALLPDGNEAHLFW